MNPSPQEVLGTVLFALAILHTFSVKRFQHLASRYPSGSVGENFFHLLGEVEVVFGLWAAVLAIGMTWMAGGKATIAYVEALQFTEPVFVFVIMATAATRPVRLLAERVVEGISRLLPLGESTRFYIGALVVGPLLGSFITEPAAMTLTALLLKDRYFTVKSRRFLYGTLAVLFVNISIGGVLTHFAAPPVLMVAGTWGWGISHMFTHFGWKAMVAVVINAAGAALLFRPVLRRLDDKKKAPTKAVRLPVWLYVLHVLFLGAVVYFAHHPAIFVPVFLFFLGMIAITGEYQDELKLREAMLVGFFLWGLVVLGGLQQWWLRPLLLSLGPFALFLGSTLLTGFVDNAALTYLVAQVPNIAEPLKYAAVAGAVAGGGLTVIANAPNPAGYSILYSSFGEGGISPAALFGAAVAPTLVAMACLWLL